MRAHSSYFRRKNSKKGLALSTTMAICIVLAILVALLVSLASVNIGTTQVTIDQREAYVQAKSAISFAESYYSQNPKRVPGGTLSGEGLVVFKTDNVADGAIFYETKKGVNATMGDNEIKDLKTNCPNTYIEVTNAKSSSNVSKLTLNAVCKYGDEQAYTLAKEYTLGGLGDSEANAFTGSINYQTTNFTRYVRFHVHATQAFDSAPFFYMWYNQISPAPDSGKPGVVNLYAQSSIVNKLTWNDAYSKVQNGSWDKKGPAGDCAMSYEGGGWWVTQKTFNLDRNLHFVNGIITRANSVRDAGDDQQSWEFFGIPIPAEDELGAANGVDIYFEVNQNNLKDMKGQKSDGKDFFTSTYTGMAGGSSNGGKTQLDNFVKFCSEWYTVYTKSETAIVHYKETGATDQFRKNSEGKYIDSSGNATTNSSQYVSTSMPGFTYEGYGWWRDWSHDFGKTISIDGATYSYGSGRVVSQNTYGKERLLELYVCYDPKTGSSASFGSEEEANQWFVKHGDLSAGDYVEVNVKAVGQPVDKNDAPETTIQYSAEIFKSDVEVPTYEKATFNNPDSSDPPAPTGTAAQDDELEFQKLALNSAGNYYLVGTMNGWQDGKSWNALKDQLEDQGGNVYTIDVDVTPRQQQQFLIVQKPDYINRFYLDGDFTKKGSKVNRNAMYQNQLYPNETYPNVGVLVGDTTHENYTNFWGTGTEEDGYKSTFTPKTNKIRITFSSPGDNAESIDVRDIGEIPEDNCQYSVVGWMNQWGKKQDGVDSMSGHGRYELTRDMEMYADVDNVMTYSDNTLTVLTGQTLKFKIAERDPGTTEGDIDWTRVYGRKRNDDGVWVSAVTNVEGDDDTSVEITPPTDPDGKIHKYLITITLEIQDDGSKLPNFSLVETSNVDKFYAVGEFNGWSTDDADTYTFDDMLDYTLEEQGADQNDIIYSYKLKSLQEAGTYDVRIVPSSAKTEEGLVNYDLTWGEKISNEEGNENYLVTQGSTAAKSYTLSDRAYVTINFTYHKNDPGKSEITFSITPPAEDTVHRVHVGFHNDKLLNVNDHSKDSKFSTPWEKVYITYYTGETGFNCFAAKKADDGVNWWADIPEDAEYCYFSNKKTSVYKQLHSADFEYTDNISSAKFKGSESTIFFPIISENDSENRKRWTTGDSQEYNMYVNLRTKIEHKTETMAYYGSIQCNYYDAPIVNVLNMLASGSPSPSQKWAFSSYPYTDFKVNDRYYLKVPSFKGSNAKVLSYQGEKYYAVPCSLNSSSFLIVWNDYSTGGGKNYASMIGYMFEGDMSLKENSGDWKTNIYGGTYHTKEHTYKAYGNTYYENINSSNVGNFLYMWNRAGGNFVSDETYKDGSPSYFNYGGYTPSWYTFRIPVTTTVKIEKINGVLSAGQEIINNNKSFEAVRESQNVNRDVYIYKPKTGDVQAYSYNPDRGVVDADAESWGEDKWVDGEKITVRHLTGKVTVSAYFSNTESWSNVYVHAYGPIGQETYAKLNQDNKASGSDNKGYYVFPFDQGKYSFFQFYEAPDKDAEGHTITNKASAAALEAAEHKSSIIYFTGEELANSYEKNYDEFAGYDSRTTRILAEGSATGFTWYMHPRTKVMHAYLDLNSVFQLTKIPKRYLYSTTQGTYTYKNNEILEMTGLGDQEESLKNKYYSSGPWSSDQITDYSGLLEAATYFMDAVREARIYSSDDVTKAKNDTNPSNWEDGKWIGDDPTHMMVFMEGEQIRQSIFEYTDRWKDGLKDLLKRYTQPGASEYMWGNNTSRQTVDKFNECGDNLRLWLNNPQALIKSTAVIITVDDAPKDGLGGWGKESIRLYVKNKTTNEWAPYTSEILTTSQKNFYAFAFDFPNEDDPSQPNYNMYNGCEFTVCYDQPDENSMVGGNPVKTVKIYAGGRFRYNTCEPIGSDKSFDEDGSTETLTYDGTEIRDGDNSPTAKLNEWIGRKRGAEFILNFKYDTTISGHDKNGASVDYTIFAGTYSISEETYGINFYKDFGSDNYSQAEANKTPTGIDLFTQSAKTFFTTPSNYGMHSAKKYTDWRTNKDNSTKDVDILTNNITKSGSISASAQKNTVSFRYNGVKGSDTLKVDRNISLIGDTVVIAANTIDFRSAGGNDFTLKAKTIVFKTDTIIKTGSGNYLINHGTYQFITRSESDRLITVSLKSTDDSGNDWRNRYKLTDKSSKLSGGVFVAK